ncbi:hypothetical protein FB451DRAFT_1549539 [Mycena latifolia]|nr:hypothetical protein FB451DRAFT_1549539 [Mycena latifolia]
METQSQSDPADSPPTNSCELGSILLLFLSPSFPEIEAPEDIIAAYKFSKTTGVLRVAKNTGHDFKGRSAMALWISYALAFVAEGCTDAFPGVKAGAGVPFFEAFEFAEANNITLGGGHGVLAPALGFGFDRALAFKVVKPDGVYRTANACHNEDLFFALRGGGSGTFGSPGPRGTPRAPRCSGRSALIADNMLSWADTGWGGYAMPELALFVTQCLDKDAAAASMAPLIVHAEQMKAESVEGAMRAGTPVLGCVSLPSPFPGACTNALGYGVSLTSRLPRASFASESSHAKLGDALLGASGAPLMLIQITAPTAASVTPAWHDRAPHHEQGHVPLDAAYLNEAHVYEPNFGFRSGGSIIPSLR